MIFIPLFCYSSEARGFLPDFLWLFGGVFRLYADHLHDHGTSSGRWPEDDKIFSGKARFLFLSVFVL